MKRIFIFLAIIAPICFVSCNSNEPQEYETVLLPHSWVIHKYNEKAYDGVEISHGNIKFHNASSTYEGIKDMQFHGVGKVSGINKITSIPNDGWQNTQIETAEQNGYLIRYHKNGDEGGWKYRRFYLKEYILLGGEDWYCKMQYDAKEWNPLTDK